MEARVCHRQKSLFFFKKKVLWDNRVAAFTNIYIYIHIYANIIKYHFNRELDDKLLDSAVWCYMFGYTQVEMSFDNCETRKLAPLCNQTAGFRFPFRFSGPAKNGAPLPSQRLKPNNSKLNIFFWFFWKSVLDISRWSLFIFVSERPDPACWALMPQIGSIKTPI